MRNDLLLRGADLLEADANNPNGIKFDLGVWVKPSSTGAEEPVFYTFPEPVEKLPVNCETTACAVGLFCLSGQFEKDGLGYEFHQQSGGYILIPTFTDKDGDKFDTFQAAAQLFRISHDDAQYLFDPDSYDVVAGAGAELDVAARIRNFIKGEIDYDYHPAYKDDHATDD